MTKLALITGASRGLGAAIAEELAPEYHVVAVARTVGALEELDDRIKARGGAATLAPMDITDPNAMAHMCRGIHDRWGHADLWVHTAVHAAPLAPVSSIDDKDFDKSAALNIKASQILIKMVEPLLLAAPDGQAIYTDDPQAGLKFFGAYGATKAAQTALFQSWQRETERTGPKVHIATPEPMPTAVRARFFPGEDKDALAHPKTEAVRILKEVGIA